MSEENRVPQRKGPPVGGRFAPGEKPKNFKGTLKKLLDYIGAYKIPILIVMVLAAVATVFSVAGPKIMAKATNALFEGLARKIAGTGGIDFGLSERYFCSLSDCIYSAALSALYRAG